ncbi:conserved hypothetical protein [Prochlorococcus marinus str. MIT 9211]|uniref:DUF3143 domain-containing protein n=1 Tax=Prochlorococcus marinus (strain MIT 9211) TaxID=93059 RepID=A9BCG2_PROM4|nr:conserved hypothetical protein [Prochlorococcus marinus str. MIT 9211]
MTSIELWLSELGAVKSADDPCLWQWHLPKWLAEIELKQDELRVTWTQDTKKSQFDFPYGLPRQDVEAALVQGP